MASRWDEDDRARAALIASAISDTLGRSGRAILDAIIAGETDPEKLVALCSGRLKASRKSLSRRCVDGSSITIASSMLTAAYHILRDSVPYKDLGPDHFTRRDKKYAVRRLQRRIEDLGFAVEIRPTTVGVSI